MTLVSPTISIPSSFSISIVIVLPFSKALVQLGCFKLLTTISLVDESVVSLCVIVTVSLYSNVLVITVVLVSLSYEYQIFTSNEPSITIFPLTSDPLNLCVMVFGDNFLPFFKQLT